MAFKRAYGALENSGLPLNKQTERVTLRKFLWHTRRLPYGRRFFIFT